MKHSFRALAGLGMFAVTLVMLSAVGYAMPALEPPTATLGYLDMSSGDAPIMDIVGVATIEMKTVARYPPGQTGTASKTTQQRHVDHAIQRKEVSGPAARSIARPHLRL